jgi:hypothetical protein
MSFVVFAVGLALMAGSLRAQAVWRASEDAVLRGRGRAAALLWRPLAIAALVSVVVGVVAIVT